MSNIILVKHKEYDEFLQIYNIYKNNNLYLIKTPIIKIKDYDRIYGYLLLNSNITFYDFLQNKDKEFNSFKFKKKWGFIKKYYIPIINNSSFNIYIPDIKNTKGEQINLKIYNNNHEEIKIDTFENIYDLLINKSVKFVINPIFFVKNYEYKVVFRVIIIYLL